MKKVIALYEQGHSIRSISKTLAIRRERISQILKENNVPLTPRVKPKKYNLAVTPDYSFLENKILLCKKTGKVFTDVYNRGGSITHHIAETYPKEYKEQFSSKWLRLMQAKTGTLWYLPFFVIKEKVAEAEKPVVSDAEIIRLYTTENLSTHAIGEQLHLGHKKVTQVLQQNNIPVRKQGGQPKYNNDKVVDYSFLNGKMLICKDTRKTFLDVMNVSGAITTHIQSLYPQLVIPSAYKRRMLASTGVLWYLDYFEVSDISEKPTRKCQHCEWETTDINNNTGCFEVHLRDVHNITIQQHLKLHPQDQALHPAVHKETSRVQEIESDSVRCAICGMKLKAINNKHLKKHGITNVQYKLRFPLQKYVANSTKQKLSTLQKNTNINIINYFSSKGETEIRAFLNACNIKAEKNKKILGGIEVDMVIEERKIGIEYDGLYYHGERFGKTRTAHLEKTEKMAEKGYRLIHIFEDEWEKNKELVKDKLKHVFGVAEGIKTGGRKCQVSMITRNEKNAFLKQHHIQGTDKSSLAVGAFYKDQLIAVMTFNNKRNMNGGNDDPNLYDLSRYATDSKYITQGLASKMLRFFIKEHKPSKIISFADRRWTPDPTDNLYTKMGFTLAGITPPNYYYYNSSVSRYDRFHKFQFGKSGIRKRYKIDTEGKTEWELMKSLGYDRIWDCGLFKYELSLTNEISG